MFYYTFSPSKWFSLLRRVRRPEIGQGLGQLRFLAPDGTFPRFVRRCPVTMRTIAWLRWLGWHSIVERLSATEKKQRIMSKATYIAAYLVKLDAGLATMGQLHRYLCDHPALAWALGFSEEARVRATGDDLEVVLPSQRQLSRMLSTLDNQLLQSLLDEQVATLKQRLSASFAQIIALDTKHILAWTRENNPKVYVKEGRFDKSRQATGDPDCKVGCKRRHNRQTPGKEGKPASGKSPIGEFYWGYASGVVVTKVAGGGEFILAELTQTFDHGETTYFFPLMQQVERRLGFKPLYGTADAAFDAFYVYDYFHQPATGGMAVVPFSQPNGLRRQFDEQGFPLCPAGLAMSLRKKYLDQTKAIIPHERAFYACPLLHPSPTGDTCPVAHPQWPKGGCSTQMPTSPGARIRHQLDRTTDLFKQIYKERTAVERIFAQAVLLGIERPKLRHQKAITNLNTLIYLLINVRTMQRLFGRLD